MSSVRPFGLPRRVALAAAAVAVCTGTALPAYADDVRPSDMTSGDGSPRNAWSRDSWDADPLGTADDSGRPGRGSGRTASGGITVSPSEAAPGDEIHVRVQGCRGSRATAHSEAFTSDVRLAAGRADDRALSAFTRIQPAAEPGTYRVRTDCDAEGTVTVLGHHGLRSGHGAYGMPSAPVRAGGGGTASLAAEQQGPSTGQVVVGLSLAGGAGLAVAGIVRRRRASVQADD